MLDYPAERREVVEQIVQELVRRIARDLAERREGVVQLSCRLDCAGGRPLLLEVGLFRPSADPEHLWDLMRMQFEQTSLPGSVGRVTLAAITDRDLPVITGIILLSAVVFVVVNLVVEFTYPLLDPRLRRAPGAGVAREQVVA